MMKQILVIAIAAMLVVSAAPAMASQLVYKPIDPAFGGDPLNGNWLLSQGTAQSTDGGSPGFTIDFPDFGDLGQDGVTDEDPLPEN
jgi:curli production assembly/transport component CsgF